MPLPLQSAQLLAAGAVLLIGALVQGSIGFGMALVAAPLLALIDPVLVPGPIIVVGLLLAVLMTWRERQAVDLATLRLAFPGLVLGSLLAGLLVSDTAADNIRVPIGILVLIAVFLSAIGLHVPPTPRNVLGAATLAGFMNTAASVGGPPLALIYQHAGGPRLRSTLAPLFVVCGLISLGTLAALGHFGARELGLGMALTPGMVLGLGLSRLTARWLDRGSVRHGVLAVAAAAGVAAIWQGWG